MSCRVARPTLDEVYHFAHSVVVVRAPIQRDAIARTPPRISNGSFVEGRSPPLRSGVGRQLPDATVLDGEQLRVCSCSFSNVFLDIRYLVHY